MKLTEKILIGLAILAIVFKFMHLPGGSVLFVIALQLLSIIYFLFGFLLFNGIRFRNIFKKEAYQHASGLRIFGAASAGITLSTLTTGIMFKLMFWPGAGPMLVVSLVPSIVILVIALVKFLNSKAIYYRQVLVRVGIYFIIAVVLFLTGNLALVKIQYRDAPAYVAAWEALEKDPYNPELQKKVDLERNRLILSPEDFKQYEEYVNSQKSWQQDTTP
ncbi:MAG: hypothetical protein ACJ77K_10175 [Bacteroidia bacterium]